MLESAKTVDSALAPLFEIANGGPGSAVALEEVRATGHLVQVDYRPGLRRPLWQTAHGRAILAFLPGGAEHLPGGAGEGGRRARSRRRPARTTGG